MSLLIIYLWGCTIHTNAHHFTPFHTFETIHREDNKIQVNQLILTYNMCIYLLIVISSPVRVYYDLFSFVTNLFSI